MTDETIQETVTQCFKVFNQVEAQLNNYPNIAENTRRTISAIFTVGVLLSIVLNNTREKVKEIRVKY